MRQHARVADVIVPGPIPGQRGDPSVLEVGCLVENSRVQAGDRAPIFSAFCPECPDRLRVTGRWLAHAPGLDRTEAARKQGSLKSGADAADVILAEQFAQ